MDDDVKNASLKAQIAALQGKIESTRQQQVHPLHPRPTPPGRGTHRWSPYGTAPHRGRGGASLPIGKHQPILNRPDAYPPVVETGIPTPPTDFVSPRPHQLINKDALERHQMQEAVKRQRELVIDGIRFRLDGKGSKLTRIPDDDTKDQETPKTTKVAGVDFHRTKNGNLIRVMAANTPTRPQCEHFTKHGKCPFGQSCRFAHDPEQVAICPAFLKNKCSAGDFCDLSHIISYHRVPACLHFLRGNCTNDACRYPHVNVSPSAPVCRAFASLGYCANANCDQRHIFECPDYANNGSCINKRCQLPHIDHAAVLRNAAARHARSSDDEQDVSSDRESVRSDGSIDIIMMENSGHELSQQHDYVPFY